MKLGMSLKSYSLRPLRHRLRKSVQWILQTVYHHPLVSNLLHQVGQRPILTDVSVITAIATQPPGLSHEEVNFVPL